MKKTGIFILLFTVAFSYTLQGQGTVSPETMLSYDLLKKRKEKSDEDIQHEKKSLKAKTWSKRGDLMQDIFDLDVQLIHLGMDPNQAKVLMKEPNEIKTIEEEDGIKEIFVYDKINLVFKNGALLYWEKTDEIVENPLDEALASYKKALELDEKGKLEDPVKEAAERLKKKYEQNAIMAFQKQDYEKSTENFVGALETGKLPVFDQAAIDTAIIYNAGLAASNAGDHKTAVKYFNEAREHQYGGANLYLLLKKEYVELNDSTNALKALQEGFEENPENNPIIVELINYYLSTGDAEAALEYIEIAKKKDPNNSSYYFAEGTLYDKMGDKEKAIKSYQKALEIDPTYFNANYNLGVLFYNKAVSIFDSAADIVSDEEYNKAVEVGNVELRHALPYMEKAHEVDPNDITTMETLRTLYYRLQMDEEREAILKELEAAKGGTN